MKPGIEMGGERAIQSSLKASRNMFYLKQLGRMTASPETNDSLFSGIWIQWDRLTQSEKVVCFCILATPLWWWWGWSYLFLLLAGSVYVYEWRDKGEIRLKFPSIIVIGMVAFSLYDLITTYFYGIYYGTNSVGVRALVGTINSDLCPALVIWYIQSYKIRVRLKVAAWAFSVLVFYMVGGFLYVVLIANQAPHNPYRSIFGALTHKPVIYEFGAGNTNYLIFYRAEDSSVFGLVRFSYFFHGPESLAVVTTFISLLALDLKGKWRLILFPIAYFLLLTSGTRSSFLTLGFVLLFRMFITTARGQGIWVLLSLMALTSFTTLMVPPVTNHLLETIASSAKAADEFRGDSTAVRGEIYRRTRQRIYYSTDRRFYLGHVVPGETVLIGYPPAMVGTHSMYLGSLLYQKGIVGTCIFAMYWLSLMIWLFLTRRDRPLCIFLIWLHLSNVFMVMAFESTIMPILLIGITLKSEDTTSTRLAYSTKHQTPTALNRSVSNASEFS